MSSETNIFTCKFCGQVFIGEEGCDCWQARREKRIADQIRRAELAINEIFGEECTKQGYIPVSEEHIDLMNNLAKLIANEKIASASLTLVGGTKAKFARGAKNAVKIERSETKKTTTEVD